jgi:glyoxylase-like metal-dependent hydrolase (beta-lactamase superfamily II)
MKDTMNDNLIKRICADNASMFTGPGTNSYLIGHKDISLVDPGPLQENRLDKIVADCGSNLKRVLVTHTHKDHSPGAAYLQKKYSLPVFGQRVQNDDGLQDKTFAPTRELFHGDLVETDEYTIETIHTPGHASNHLCFLVKESSCILTGDHIMNGSTVVIAPPDGDMLAYINSLELLKGYVFEKIGPGHGEFMDNPFQVIDWIINHRMQRERKVLEKMKSSGVFKIEELLPLVYDDVDRRLFPLAIRSLEAHLRKLEKEGIVNKDQENWTLV